MRTAAEKQQKRHQQYLDSQIRNRWALTASYLFTIAATTGMLLQKRSQWPHLFTHPIPSGKTILDSAWVNVAELALLAFNLFQLWVHVHNYRREQFLAEQEALRKAAMPADGVWPPPPVL